MPPKVRKYRLGYDEADIAWVQDEIGAMMRAGWLTQGPCLDRFEAAFAEVSGAPVNVAVSSGTAALELLYWLYDAGSGSVVVPTNTFFASASAALTLGAKVVLADIDPRTMSPTAAEIERRLRPDTKVVCLVHVAGVVTPEFDAIRALCHARSVKLIEDAAHAHGATHQGRPAGSLADGAAFSMHHSKVLTCGEGGVVSLADASLTDRLKRRRFLGLDITRNNWEITLVGQNYKMAEMPAILGLAQLRRWRELVACRRRTAAVYDQGFAGETLFAPVNPPAGSAHGLYKYVVLLDPQIDKAAFMRRMEDEHGVELPPNVYDHPCHAQAVCDANLVNKDDAFPGADDFVRRHVCLPMYAGLAQSDAAVVVEAAVDAARRSRK